MLENYYIVHKSVLPEFIGKVIETRRLIDSGMVRDISQAVKQTGISRSTYYKYRDMVFEPSSLTESGKAVFMVMLSHVPGTLSSLLNCISSAGANVLTISQSIPVNESASVMLSLDISDLNCSVDELSVLIRKLDGVRSVRLISLG
ncbi:MAG: ACT domain-containing protein [Oscillospiraceae bacterium]|nr:ACT domain-containing protein [Oscillospiraceae bacterium]